MTRTARPVVGYVVEVNGPRVTLNLQGHYRGQAASQHDGLSPVADIGGLLALVSGHRLLVVRVTSVLFAEPREVHNQQAARSTSTLDGEPLRQLTGHTIGWLAYQAGSLSFTAETLTSPALGSEAVPLTDTELRCIAGDDDRLAPLALGTDYRTGHPIRVGLNALLSKHVAVLGSSGQGKSSFTAAVLQQLADMPRARIVIFDIAGEYDRAFKKSEDALASGDNEPRIPTNLYKRTVIGEGSDGAADFRIPYYALGRQGLHRLLLPSEKTQRPALTFAVNSLSKVEWHDNRGGASLKGGPPVLFDDCRESGATEASNAIRTLRSGTADHASSWPYMGALASLIAESHSVSVGRGGNAERSAFLYGNVAPLVTRIHRLLDDEVFRRVVDVAGGTSELPGPLNMALESERLVDRIFGSSQSEWRVHVVDLRQVPQDLMPLVLGSLLELYAHVLFRRGQGHSPSTLLVLEEAHHYLRPHGDSSDDAGSTLAYERLAKEGRKFGLSLWLSTQRPAEVSPTVLSQCNTWVTFRLTSETDLRAIASASEWADSSEMRKIAGLGRQTAIVFGGSVAIPFTMTAATANPTPNSSDGPFDDWVKEP